jgi:hypothetical protein
MKSIKSVRSISIALALLVALSFGVAASAKTPGQGDRGNRWSRGHMTRYAFALGYTRGYDDASQGSYLSYREIQRWREGTEGWEDPMGTRNSFRDNFRRGFARGFMDGRSHRTRRYTQSDVDRIREDINDRRDRRP